MSHYHMEIIIPPTDDVEAHINQLMAPFDENGEGEDHVRGAFWDFWKIGGRWSSHKLITGLGDARMDIFYAALRESKITVSALTFGKLTLQPASQASIVDDLWNSVFPDSPLKVCPLFDNYKGNHGDIMMVKEIPPGLTPETVMIAGPSEWNNRGIQAKTLLHRFVWNGCTHQETKWDGTMEAALAEHHAHIQHAREEYKAKYTVRPDWLCVTVDYHS